VTYVPIYDAVTQLPPAASAVRGVLFATQPSLASTFPVVARAASTHGRRRGGPAST
jgi:hypothetical protein